MNKHCWDVFRANICEGNCALKHTLATKKPIINTAVWILNTNGERIPISISTAILKDKSGNIIGGVETFRDLSVVEELRKQLHGRYEFGDIISRNRKMQELFEILPDIANSSSSVLIEGESGTGKELLARAIHNMSARADKPFVAVNCAAIPDTLLESELFGYKAGAFTDAKVDKPGRFTRAQGGTIFLDEIGDISSALQSKLLRVIQERNFEPLGSTESVSVDVRIITATNKNLDEMVKSGQFRQDLYYRINVVRLKLPPLRERKEDIPLLVERFISQFASIQGKDISGISESAMALLMAYNYPGNIRELQNIIEHGFVLCKGGLIEPVHLPEHIQPKNKAVQAAASEARTLGEIEKILIMEALKRNNYNRTATARELGIHKTTLLRKLKRFNITLPEKAQRN